MRFYPYSLGDTEDPDSRAGQTMRRGEVLRVKEEARRASLTPEQLRAENEAKRIRAENAAKWAENTKVLNGPVTASNPLAETLRQISVAGDWEALQLFAPFSIYRWGKNTSLGKWRFRIENGQRVYLPLSDADIDAFMSGPGFYANEFGFRPLVEPGAICTEKRLQNIGNEYKKKQKERARKFPPTNPKHVVDIFPGKYICREKEPSLWVRIRYPLLIAVGAVAAVYLGPVVSEKISGFLGKSAATAASEGGTATVAASKTAETATFFSKVKSAGNQILGYVNKARTVEAIAKGEIPPPPVSITGSSFREWAFNVAKDELQKEAKERAAELGMEYLQKKMTESEERAIKREIEQLQRELAKFVPENTPKAPNPAVPPAVVEKSAELAKHNKKDQDATLAVVAMALPVLVYLVG